MYKAYQNRVIDEKNDLDGKIERLVVFLSVEEMAEHKETTPDEKEKLNRQIKIMKDYSQVLGERIAEFAVN